MIDPKELRVGTHVEYKGERLIVGAISGTDVSLIKSSTPIAIYKDVWCAYIEPIPITPELLSELGFEIKEEFGSVSVWKKDNLIVKIIGERKVVSFVDKMHSLETCYLHELEAFVYLTTKTELIKE